jgi:hypothetical protein
LLGSISSNRIALAEQGTVSMGSVPHLPYFNICPTKETKMRKLVGEDSSMMRTQLTSLFCELGGIEVVGQEHSRGWSAILFWRKAMEFGTMRETIQKLIKRFNNTTLPNALFGNT